MHACMMEASSKGALLLLLASSYWQGSPRDTPHTRG